MGDKLPPAMEKSTPPIRSEENHQLFAATKAEMEKEKGDTITVKRKMDISAEKESGRKRKKKVKHQCSDEIKEEDNMKKEKKKEKKGRKRPRKDEEPKTEEAGSEQKRPHQEEVPLHVAVCTCQIPALLGIGSCGKVPSVDFDKTIEEPLSFLESSECLTPSSELEHPSHCWTSSNLCHSQAQPMAINSPYHPSPFGPFGFSIQPYTAYWPHVGFYQQPFPSVPYNLHPFLGPVIRPPPVSVLVPVYHNLPLDVVNTPCLFHHTCSNHRPLGSISGL
ncbi:uncharacterized protein LOC121400753 [Xenopus laevis]|uniref:Uncharacterized protein LOC121400753 n=1 Tax=Xenopus laevis TaxID=8355 RepID=A0A8J1MFZ6_XENLA|nr:uncharacterized protein LOC121400753 [Xenopus laevis]